MATIKTLIGNVKGKDGGGYEEVVLYDGDCSACINWNVISADSPMMELSDSIENYKSIRIEFTSYMGVGTEEEGVITASTTYSVNYIKQYYTYSCIESNLIAASGRYFSRQGFGFYDATHLTLTWEEYAGWTHNMSHITVTGIRDRVSDAEKNFNKYSTTEEVIGTWIDGKPIYRKVVTLSTTKTIGMGGTSISHGISNINIPIDCKGINNTACAVSDLFWTNTKNSTSGTFYNAEGLDDVKILVFEYTKTTS